MEKQVLDSPFTKKKFLNLVKQFNDDQVTFFEDFAISEKDFLKLEIEIPENFANTPLMKIQYPSLHIMYFL